MAKLTKWIEELAEGEQIESVIIGEFGWDGYGDDSPLDNKYIGKVLSWWQASPLLSYEFDDGYGAPGCHAIAAYTKSWIISVYQYDGATKPFRVARNPVDGFIPDMPGG